MTPRPHDTDRDTEISQTIRDTAEELNERIRSAGLAFAFTVAAGPDPRSLEINLYKSDQRHPQILDTRFSYGSLRVHFEDMATGFSALWMDVTLDCAMNASEKAVYAKTVEHAPV